MKWVLIAFSVLFVAAAITEDSSSSSEESGETGELTLAEPCDEEACQLPDCRCSSTNIPGGLNARDTPQFVMLTFEDGVVEEYMYTYRDIIYNRKNSNGCPAGTTFFVSHEYTDYNHVNELYNQGFEIALHSITHTPSPNYWAEADYEILRKEFADQKVQMSHFANISTDAIKGIRIPYLQLAGNASFQVMVDYDFQYDNSWATASHVNPGLWPYTLDYASTQDCVNPPCPTASIPGKWVLPVVSWLDLEGTPCAMLYECVWVPDRFFDEEGWFRFFVGNFERHYLGNRAPFGIYIHEPYFSPFPFVQRALVRFMDMLNNMEDVFMVNSDEVIDWVKNPIPVDEYRQKPCRSFTPTTCQVSGCELESDQNGPAWREHYREYCSECPNRFPWLGNPLGE